ncbi:MAG: MerR family transcriptional regulator [Clostridiales bacterium]|nr:MerR family transcriptional regulator [Clostridiales bacterium]
MRKSSDLYSIGELSKLFNIPISTLRYYDEIGLFKPKYTDKDSNYRYYSIEQFALLTLIRYLKLSHISVKEIKKIVNQVTPENYVNFLKKQRTQLKEELDNLEFIMDKFSMRINEIEEAMKMEQLPIISVKELPDRKILYYQDNITSRISLEKAIRGFEKKLGYAIDKVGLTMSYDDLVNENYDVNNGIFIKCDDKNNNKNLIKVLEAGTYVCINYRASHSDLPVYYKMIMDYIKENNYIPLKKDSIRRTIIDSSIDSNIIDSSIDKYISTKINKNLGEIQIPVIIG